MTFPQEPGLAVSNAILPPGATKEITLPIGEATSVCIDDDEQPNFAALETGYCGSAIFIPRSVGDAVVDSAGHRVTRGTPGTVTVSGLKNTLVQMWRDTDFDGFRDAQDECPDTRLDSPIPRIELRPGHMGDRATIRGCNASQILACKPGQSDGEVKYGLTPGTQQIFAARTGWAAACR